MREPTNWSDVLVMCDKRVLSILSNDGVLFISDTRTGISRHRQSFKDVVMSGPALAHSECLAAVRSLE